MSTPNENPNYAPKIKPTTTWEPTEPPRMDFLSEVKRSIKYMPYGDLISYSKDVSQIIHPEEPIDDHIVYQLASAMWKWANT